MCSQGDFLETARPVLMSPGAARQRWVQVEVQDIPGSSHGWCELRQEGAMCFGVAGEGLESLGWRSR